MKKFIFSLTVFLTAESVCFSQKVRVLILGGVVQNSSILEQLN